MTKRALWVGKVGYESHPQLRIVWPNCENMVLGLCQGSPSPWHYVALGQVTYQRHQRLHLCPGSEEGLKEKQVNGAWY